MFTYIVNVPSVEKGKLQTKLLRRGFWALRTLAVHGAAGGKGKSYVSCVLKVALQDKGKTCVSCGLPTVLQDKGKNRCNTLDSTELYCSQGRSTCVQSAAVAKIISWKIILFCLSRKIALVLEVANFEKFNWTLVHLNCSSVAEWCWHYLVDAARRLPSRLQLPCAVTAAPSSCNPSSHLALRGATCPRPLTVPPPSVPATHLFPTHLLTALTLSQLSNLSTFYFIF